MLGVTRYISNTLCNIITFVVTKYITKYAIKTGNITQDTLLTNVTCYLSKIVTVTSLILHYIITTSNVVTNLVSYPLSNAQPQRNNKAYQMKLIHQLLTYNQDLHIVQQRNHVT